MLCECGTPSTAYVALADTSRAWPGRLLMLAWSSDEGWRLALEPESDEPPVIVAVWPEPVRPAPARVASRTSCGRGHRQSRRRRRRPRKMRPTRRGSRNVPTRRSAADVYAAHRVGRHGAGAPPTQRCQPPHDPVPERRHHGHRRNRIRRRHLRPGVCAVPRPEGGTRLRPVRQGRGQRGQAGHRRFLPHSDGGRLGTGQAVSRIHQRAVRQLGIGPGRHGGRPAVRPARRGRSSSARPPAQPVAVRSAARGHRSTGPPFARSLASVPEGGVPNHSRAASRLPGRAAVVRRSATRPRSTHPPASTYAARAPRRCWPPAANSTP